MSAPAVSSVHKVDKRCGNRRQVPITEYFKQFNISDKDIDIKLVKANPL